MFIFFLCFRINSFNKKYWNFRIIISNYKITKLEKHYVEEYDSCIPNG